MMMDGQHKTRRMILGALVVLVAAATWLGNGQPASAADDGGYKSYDHGSKANFQAYCKAAGSTFSEDGLGNTMCTHKDGGYKECDANGNDCWYVPPPRRAEPVDPFDPFNGTDGQVSDDPGATESPASLAENLSPKKGKKVKDGKARKK